MSTTVVPQRSVDWSAEIPDFVASVSFSSDGRYIAAAGSGGPIFLYASDRGALEHTWTGHAGGTFRGTFSPTGSRLISVGQDSHATFWEPGHPDPLVSVKFASAWVEQAAWSPDGSAVAVAAGRQVTILRPDGSAAVALTPLPSTVSALTWRSDGAELAACAYGRIQIWNASTGEAREPLLWKTSLISLSWSPDRRWIAAGTQEQSVQIWELPFRPGEELAMSGYPGKVRGLAWHYGSRFLATDGGPEVMVWDCAGRGPAGSTPRILEGHAARISAMAYQRSGHLLATGGDDGQVLLWNAGKSSSPLWQFRMPSAVTSLDWSRDDQFLAIGCRSGAVASARPGI